MRRCWLALAAMLALAGLLMRRVFTAVRFCGFLCLCAVPVCLLWGFLSAQRGRRWADIVRWVLAVCIGAGFALFAVIEIQVIAAGHTDEETSVEAVVILGAGVNGTQPSLSLQVRLEAALDYLSDKPEIPVVVSGAQGGGEAVSEARCMADWLAGHGVDPGRIHLEEQARSTAENVWYAKEMLRVLGVGSAASVAVVTADYHLYRASLYWDDPGFVPVAAHMPVKHLPLTINYYIREVFGVVYLSVLG